jgi:hypothetical protein
VDDRRPWFPSHDPCRQFGTDTVPIAADVQHSVEPGDSLAVTGPIDHPSAAVQGESSPIVYYGSDERVREGFALALFAMGVAAHPPADLAPPDHNPNREDN